MARTRVQVDLDTKDATLLELLTQRLSVRSRADLLQQAYGAFLWVVDEMLAGRHIISVDTESLNQLDRYKELSMPSVEPVRLRRYRYLVSRPEKGRDQLYLKGRNMTVGQLIYKMRANQLAPQEAARDMDLPLEQVLEALAYYETHCELVESEISEDKQILLSQGVTLEPGSISG